MKICSNCNNPHNSVSVRWPSCTHMFCVHCSRIPEKCKICYAKCLSCDQYTLRDQLCQEKILCFQCNDRLKALEKCDFCHRLKYYLKAFNCYHKICTECEKQWRNCIICNKTCAFCGSRGILRKLRCGHEACNDCSKNEECVECVFSTRNRIIDKYEICFKCSLNKNVYGILLCGHSICRGCVDYEVLIFDYKCHFCSLGKNNNFCITHRVPYQWELYGELYYKKCCDKYFCIICRKFKEYHKC